MPLPVAKRPPRASFLGLPAELRCIIYGFAFEDSCIRVVSGERSKRSRQEKPAVLQHKRHSYALLLACRTAYDEGFDYYLPQTTVESDADFKATLKALPCKAKPHVRHLLYNKISQDWPFGFPDHLAELPGLRSISIALRRFSLPDETWDALSVETALAQLRSESYTVRTLDRIASDGLEVIVRVKLVQRPVWCRCGHCTAPENPHRYIYANLKTSKGVIEPQIVSLKRMQRLLVTYEEKRGTKWL